MDGENVVLLWNWPDEKDYLKHTYIRAQMFQEFFDKPGKTT